ncbi:MAG: hypothetical protein ACRENW_00565 [Thermodesulfobacteriota bacterium]
MDGARISDDSVSKRTGKGWKEWFTLLDKAGAMKMEHRSIAEHLHSLGVPSWWCQMVAVAYEHERGLREKYQTAAGYSVSASRTLDIPLGSLYSRWSDGKLRSKWLKVKLVVRSETKNKSLRITWPDNTTVDVYFYGKGPGKSQVAVQHNKLASAKDVERVRARWKAALDRLSKTI